MANLKTHLLAVEIKQNFDTLDIQESVDREMTKELLLKFRL